MPPLDPKTEKELAQRLPQDRRAFELLYEHYMPKIYRYISYKTGASKAQIEDHTSAVFEKAWSKLAQYNTNKGAFGAWLYKIAQNHLTDDLRKNRPSSVALDDIPELTHDGPRLSVAHILEQKVEVARLLDHLTPNEREMVSLKFSSGFTNREIAKMVDLSESNVGVILFRIMKKLRRILQSDNTLPETH